MENNTTDLQIWITLAKPCLSDIAYYYKNTRIIDDDIFINHVNRSLVSLLWKTNKGKSMYQRDHVEISVELFHQLIKNRGAGFNKESNIYNVDFC